jgi:hypothetical protein
VTHAALVNNILLIFNDGGKKSILGIRDLVFWDVI